MNLLELMLKDGVEWPVGAEFAAQDDDGALWWFTHKKPLLMKSSFWYGSDGDKMFYDDGMTIEISDDWSTRIITSGEYQAAGGKMEVDSDDASPSLSAAEAATAKQATPKGLGNPILGMVLADLTNRALEGTAKYGEPLKAHNGRNPLWDAYQEALDLAMYLRQAIEEQR